MSDGKKRLDESMSREALQKSLTGKTGTRPAVEDMIISPSGQVQPKPPTTTTPQNTGSSGGSNRGDK